MFAHRPGVKPTLQHGGEPPARTEHQSAPVMDLPLRYRGRAAARVQGVLSASIGISPRSARARLPGSMPAEPRGTLSSISMRFSVSRTYLSQATPVTG